MDTLTLEPLPRPYNGPDEPAREALPARDAGGAGEAGGAAADGIWALGFGTALALGAGALGGKGWSLARMHAAGLPVPAGFCIPAAAFERFLAHNDLDLAQAWARGDEAALADIAQRIRRAAFPPGAAEQILQAHATLGAVPVAVRSSALGEDSVAHSFAGQYATFLYVRGADSVLDSVRNCWASLLNAGALAYRRERGAAAAGPYPDS